MTTRRTIVACDASYNVDAIYKVIAPPIRSCTVSRYHVPGTAGRLRRQLRVAGQGVPIRVAGEVCRFGLGSGSRAGLRDI